MLQSMFLAHLLGDYVLQTDGLVRWKSRSLWGVLAHGGLVALCAWLCSLPFSLDWWPYALLIGAIHTVIDVARVQLGKVGPASALFLFLADQALHILAILLVVRASGWMEPRAARSALGAWLQEDHRLPFIGGYVLLGAPAWVLVHFLVRGMGAASTSLPGRPGERYVGMLERALIATFVLFGQFLAVPLVLAPRLTLDGASSRAEAERIGYLGEVLVSASLAVVVGLFLRGLG